MRRKAVFLLVLANAIAYAFAGTMGVSLTYSPNMEFEQRFVEAVSFEDDGLSIHIVEHEGRRADVSFQYNIDSTGCLSHTVLANASWTYGLCGWGGVGYMLGFSGGWNDVRFKASVGVQLASAYSPYFDGVLFSFTPIAEAEVRFVSQWLEACTYMSFVSPYGREWKAVPSVGGKVSIQVSKFHWIGCEAFVKFSEFLTDTRTMVNAFGIRLSCRYGMEVRP